MLTFVCCFFVWFSVLFCLLNGLFFVGFFCWGVLMLIGVFIWVFFGKFEWIVLLLFLFFFSCKGKLNLLVIDPRSMYLYVIQCSANFRQYGIYMLATCWLTKWWTWHNHLVWCGEHVVCKESIGILILSSVLSSAHFCNRFLILSWALHVMVCSL